MTDITEEAVFDSVPLLTRGTKVEGDEAGPSNGQAQALANRTLYLKEQQENLDLAILEVAETANTAKSTAQAAQDALADKVDKVVGKGLSSEDYTAEEKAKLAGLESSHFKGMFSSLVALEAAVLSPVAGDYADVDAGEG